MSHFKIEILDDDSSNYIHVPVVYLSFCCCGMSMICMWLFLVSTGVVYSSCLFDYLSIGSPHTTEVFDGVIPIPFVYDTI